MRLAIGTLAIALLALLAPAPTPALAAKDPAAFSINVRASLYCPPDDLCYYRGKFSAGGAIVKAGIAKSSGPIPYSDGTGYFVLDVGTDNPLVVMVGDGTFAVYVYVFDGTYSDLVLVGTGTAVGGVENDRVHWRLDGNLVGG